MEEEKKKKKILQARKNEMSRRDLASRS